MPPPEPRTPREAPPARHPGGHPDADNPRSPAPVGRQRPRPHSALAPSPVPLMPVPDHHDQPDEPLRGQPRSDQPYSDRAGRRQFHRTARDTAPHSDPEPGPAPEELVYLSGRVPRALRDELHIQAIRDGRPVVELLRDAIRFYLDQRHR